MQVADFSQRNYGPSSLTIAIVGDVDPDQVLLLRKPSRSGS